MLSSVDQRFVFDGGYVMVTVPAQGKRFKVVSLTKDPAMETRDTDDFKPMRVAINFIVVEDADPAMLVTHFDPPLELRVRYNRSDLRLAEFEKQPLALAYWFNDRWILFEKKHEFHLEPDDPEYPEKGGYGVAIIRDWGDPHIAWGTKFVAS